MFRRIVTSMFVVLAVSGCAGHVSPQPAATTEPVSFAPVGDAIPDGGTVMTEEYMRLANATDVAVPAALDDEHMSVPWALTVFSPKGASSIFVAYPSGGSCGRVLGVDVVETHETIAISAVAEPTDDVDACIAEGAIEGGQLALEHVLGDRQLMHGALSSPWDEAADPLPLRPMPQDWIDQLEPEPTAAPVLQDEVYITSEGMGDIRIGQPMPRDGQLARYDEELCGGGGGDFSGGWAPKAPFDQDTAGHRVFDAVTERGFPGDEVTSIWLFSAEIPTKSGIRVGDTLESLQQRFPDLGEPEATEGGDAFSIEGDAGTIYFLVGYPDYRGEWEGGVKEVRLILVWPKGEPLPPFATDTNLSCKG